MESKNKGKRFGVIAIEKGYLTKEQFLEAMGVQIENELEGMEFRLLGSILLSLGFMTVGQVNEVLNEIPDF